VPLSRHIFKAPTLFYTAGVVFLVWLNGLPDHFIMVDGQEIASLILPLSGGSREGTECACNALRPIRLRVEVAADGLRQFDEYRVRQDIQ
jgi:Protein of unknown function (DUF993)